MLSARPPVPSCSTSFCSPTSIGAGRIGEFYGHPESRTFAELLIDCEEDRALRAVLVGILREADSQPFDHGPYTTRMGTPDP